jgi:RecA/RadA recombinase
MAKKKTTDKTEVTPKETPSFTFKNKFLAGLSKRTGVSLVPISELVKNNKTTYIDTGSYSFNALVSGSIFGGVPSDTIVGIAGEQATGKTYLCLSIVEKFLKSHPEAVVIYFDTEWAVKPNVVIERQLPEDRFIIKRVNTIEEFRMMAVRFVDDYMAQPEDERPPMMFVLDSLGNISTVKEMKEAGIDIDKQTLDMTKAKVVRSVFRVLSIKLGEANVPLLVTNHIGVKIGGFTRPGMPPPKVLAAGEGLSYAASTIIFLSKSKVYDETEKVYTGSELTGTLYKSRTTKENLKADTLLDYTTGMDRYWGLFELAKKHGAVEKCGNGFKFPFEGAKQFFTKNIEENPEEYFTPEVLALVEEKVSASFRYGNPGVVDETEKAV